MRCSHLTAESLRCVLWLPLLLCTVPVVGSEPLTEAEKAQLAEVEGLAKRTPAIRKATTAFQAARNAYRLDRQKFPAERDPSVAKQYRAALAEYEAAVRQVMRELRPEAGPLLERQAELAKLGLAKANEGETLADSDSPSNRAIQPIHDEPGLPRVLLIGDSISIGYTLGVREQLRGQASVHRIPVNGGATEVGLKKMKLWLGKQPWDVIHFNFGLHDAKFASATTQRTTREQYAANLRALVEQMRATGARLIFATTTPVPKDGVLSPTRRFDSIPARNKVAVEVMEQCGVSVNDLYAAVLPVQEQVGRSNDVHFQPQGYELLAKAVAASIEAELAQRAQEQAGSARMQTLLHAETFEHTAYGRTPPGWLDLVDWRPNRNWAVDGRGFVRPLLKNKTGLLVYDGATADSVAVRALADAVICAEFRKTEDADVAFGIAGRVVDRDNYYLARFVGNQQLELLIVQDGVETPLDAVPAANTDATRPTGMISLRRYREGERWRLSLAMEGALITARLLDAEGREQACLSASNRELQQGHAGLCCTPFAAASEFRIEAVHPVVMTDARAPIAREDDVAATQPRDYAVLRPHWQTTELDTPRERLADEYDVIVAGAGTGGWAAALQAARLGARVLLLEETDWIGGQMSAAGVTTMDEDSVWMKFPVRERGLYREFHESIVLHYQTLDKDPFVAYYGWPDQLEGGYEPKATRAVLYGFIKEARDRGAVLDLSLRTRVVAVTKEGETVRGAKLEFGDGARHTLNCRILIDATEYGDVIPLTGARYRVGDGTSDNFRSDALVQDHTWTCVVREYPEGVPDHLLIKQPPPGYELGSGRRYQKFTNDGIVLWGAAGKGIKGKRHWRVFFAWRGMADAESTLTGIASSRRHTQCGFNGGNDYAVTAATIEDRAQRAIDERTGIYKTLGALYYFQHELGLNWSLAEDEGYATAANRARMRALDLRPDLEAIAVHLPQHPYVRECRRIVGVETLTAKDLTRYENAKHVRSSVAMGDYFMDLDHGETAHQIERDLDSGALPAGGGPFQVPLEVFIPERIDGFLPAEKNLSQSRLANGATRLQPITMLTGQAAGTMAALAVKRGVQPRALDAIQVQHALLESGCTLIQRWYADVPWGTEIWQATQLLSLHQVMDRPGPIDTDNSLSLGARAKWGVNEPLQAEELRAALQRLSEIKQNPVTLPESFAAHPTAGEFAIVAARLLVE